MRNIAFSIALAAVILSPSAAFAAAPQTCADGTQIEAPNTGYIFGFVQSWLCTYDTAWSFVEIQAEQPELVR